MSNFTKTQIDGITANQLFNRLDRLEQIIQEISLPTPTKEETIYLTRSQVAELLQVSKQTLIIWHKKGVLSAIRIGTRVRYLKSDVEKLMHQSRGSK